MFRIINGTILRIDPAMTVFYSFLSYLSKQNEFQCSKKNLSVNCTDKAHILITMLSRFSEI